MTVRSTCACLIVALLGCAPATPARPGATPATAVTTLDTLTMRAVTRVLASDSLMGRKTGTAGGAMAARFIADKCTELGLIPVSGSSYFQRVPLREATVDPEASRIRVIGPGVDTVFLHHDEFIADVGTGRTLRDFAGDLVYVGRAPDILFRRSDLPALVGKVALMRGEFGAAIDG